MYVWYVEYQERWDWDEEGFFAETDSTKYVVTAKSYEQALEKSRKVALKRNFFDGGPEGDHKRHYVTDVRLVSIKRGDELDA